MKKKKPIKRPYMKKSTKFKHRNVKCGEAIFKSFSNYLLEHGEDELNERKRQLDAEYCVVKDFLTKHSRLGSCKLPNSFDIRLYIDMDYTVIEDLLKCKDLEPIRDMFVASMMTQLANDYVESRGYHGRM